MPMGRISIIHCNRTEMLNYFALFELYYSWVISLLFCHSLNIFVQIHFYKTQIHNKGALFVIHTFKSY